MQEIAPHIFIETAYPGVTLGAIHWPHGLLLLDAPVRPDDVRSWRIALLAFGGGVERMLINLDAHPDRTIGARAMECVLLSHENAAEAIRNRPITFKSQSSDGGAEWENHPGIGGIRWAAPDITFGDRVEIHWDGSPLLLNHRPGPNPGAIWAEIPGQQVIFVGDAVVPDAPPFLAGADLALWQAQLQELLGRPFQNYLIVSGRGGLVTQAQVRKQVQFLAAVQRGLDGLIEKGPSAPAIERLANRLLGRFEPDEALKGFYLQRLRHGLTQLALRTFQSGPPAPPAPPEEA